MKNVNVTFSIPSKTYKALQKLVGRRKMSQFIAKAIANALEDKRMELKKEYMQAAKDPIQRETIEDWNAIDTEGWE